MLTTSSGKNANKRKGKSKERRKMFFLKDILRKYMMLRGNEKKTK
jgi:hypothetical protein